RQQMLFHDVGGPSHNYMWHAARAFFEEGGQRLYISRVFQPLSTTVPNQSPDGYARFSIPGGGNSIDVMARFPGLAGNMRVRITLQLGPNVLSRDANGQTVARGLLQNDVVVVRQVTSPLASPLQATYATADSYFDTGLQQQTWRFLPATGPQINL